MHPKISQALIKFLILLLTFLAQSGITEKETRRPGPQMRIKPMRCAGPTAIYP
jgi:hypothetical protein